MTRDSITLSPVAGPLAGTIRPPGSKSITNRALVCAALARGTSRLIDPLDSDDTRVMVEALGKLGIGVQEVDDGESLQVEGRGGSIPAPEAELFIGNSGTTVRFLTAMLALGEGTYRLDGVPRMRERPIGDLLTALSSLGKHAIAEHANGCPPVVVSGPAIQGGTATVASDVSSQFLSGLLMALPCAAGPSELTLTGPLVSEPYVRMTLRVMEQFGVTLRAAPDLSRFSAPGGAVYQGREYAIEPDASAASYFWAAAAVVGGRVTVSGLSRDSLQGDVAFVDLLARMGCEVMEGDDQIEVIRQGPLRGIQADMNAISDTAQTLAAVALFAEGPTTITGIAHNRHKETDRIGALATELRKLGATVDEFDDGFRITPGPLRPATIETYDDHRMAMSLSLVGLRQPGVEILNPQCTAKTYPRFFADLQQLCGV